MGFTVQRPTGLRRPWLTVTLLLVLLCTALAPTALAQGTLADYQRAAKLVVGNIGKLVVNSRVSPTWLPESDRFYYARQTPAGKEFVLVDPVAKTRAPAFDHAVVSAALSKTNAGSYTASTLPFDRFEFLEDGAAIRFDLKDDQWTCRIAAAECTKTGKSQIAGMLAAQGEVRSPDGRWAAYRRDHNLYLKGIGSNPAREIQLTNDGIKDYDYASTPGSGFRSVMNMGRPPAPSVLWSPDSTKLLTYRLDQRRVPLIHLVQSVPPQGVRPVLFSYHFAFPGDPPGLAKLMVFDIAGEKTVVFDAEPQLALVADPIGIHRAWWGRDNQSVYCAQFARDFKELSLWVADVQSGRVRTLIEEQAEAPLGSSTSTGAAPQIKVLGHGEEIIWYSDRDGWGHLYLYDGKTGALKNQITRGPWPVRNIERVDEAGRWVYFTAGGREAGQDPYELHLYRIKLDGTDLQLLTPEEGNHSISFSPSGKFMVDTWSRVNTPPISVLRAADGSRVGQVGELEKADISRLLATGWKPPEPFHVTASDGTTELYGVIYRPSNFDASKSYPVIEDVYPGPQLNSAPKTFDAESQDQALAELGFIVVNMDGMGGPYRSRAFQLFSYGKLGTAGDLADHIASLRQLAKKYPYMDLERVGIFGHSGGGYASARAMMAYPDFYKVAVASSGNHDQRGYEAVWGERWEGMPVGDNYGEQVTARLAPSLKGKLLLVYGDMDENVPPALTLQLVDALIKANRDFDLLVMPNQGHGGVRNNPYFWRRRWDYFVKNLLKVEPPANFKMSADGK